MNAECTRTKLMFHGLGGRQVVGRFDGGRSPPTGVASSARRSTGPGFWVLRLTDHREPTFRGFKQRVLGLCLGSRIPTTSELCRDRLLALLCDRDDLTGSCGVWSRIEGAAGGQEHPEPLTPAKGPEGRYKKIVDWQEYYQAITVTVQSMMMAGPSVGLVSVGGHTEIKHFFSRKSQEVLVWINSF